MLLSAFAYGSVPLSSFDTVLAVQRDGSVAVVERFAPLVPLRNVIWSTSTEYPGLWGIHNPRVVELLQVTSGDDRPLNYTVRHPLGRLELKIDTAGAKEIRVLYSVRNAVRFRDDRDELQWTAGQGWRGPTQQATLFVQLPSGSASVARTQVYAGGRGLVSARSSDTGPDSLSYEIPGPIRPDERLFADIVLPKGELEQPSIWNRIGWFVDANIIVLLPVATLALMLLLRWMKRLPDAPEHSIATQYEPPEGLTPAEIGLLIDDHFDPRDVTATFLDIAMRGFIHLEPCAPDEGIPFTGQDYKLQSARPKEEWNGLAPHERNLLFHTFYGGKWTKLSSLYMRFYSVVPDMQSQVVQLLRAKGLYRTDPEHAQSLRMNLLAGFFVLAFLLQIFGIFSFASSWLLWMLAVGISAPIVYYFGRNITSKSRKGLAVYRQILGFQRFLDAVESDRLERLPANLFEKFLPYALALGVEHHWERNFAGIAKPPEWVASLEDGRSDAAGLIKMLAAMARESVEKRANAARA